MNAIPTPADIMARKQRLGAWTPPAPVVLPKQPLPPEGITRSARASKVAVDREAVKAAIATLREVDAPTRKEIVRRVSLATGFPVEAITGESRHPPIVLARQFAAWLMVRRGGFSTPQAGRALGGRDHTTIIHACRRIDAIMDDAMTEAEMHFQAWKVLCAYGRNDALAFHVPNGEDRSGKIGAKLKAMGVTPGVADFIVIVNGKVHGVELKTASGRQSPAQLRFQCDLERAGGHYHVARSLNEFIGIANAIGALRVRLATDRPCGGGARTPEAPASGGPFTEGTGALA